MKRWMGAAMRTGQRATENGSRQVIERLESFGPALKCLDVNQILDSAPDR